MKHPFNAFLKLFAVALIPVMAACGTPSVEDAEASLCQDLNGFAGALSNLAQLNAQSTVKELETAKQEVVKAYQTVQTSADQVEAARLDELETAYNDFDKTVSGISGRDTLGEAAVTVNSAAEEVAAARQQLYSSLNCQ
jgi:hypothetical protein